MRSSTGEECQFTYGNNGVDYLVSAGGESVQVALGAVTAVAPVPALDDGGGSGSPWPAILSPANVAVQIGITYQGTGFAPSFRVTAITHPECLTPSGLVSACLGALDKGGPVVESFRRNLQVTTIQREGGEASIQFGYAHAPTMPWPGDSGTVTFAPTVLSEIILPDRRVHLEWGRQERPPKEATEAPVAGSYGVQEVFDQGREGQLESRPSNNGSDLDCQPVPELVHSGGRTEASSWREPCTSDQATPALRNPVIQLRHYAFSDQPCRTYIRERWELLGGPGTSSEEANLRAPYRYGEDIPTFEQDPMDLTMMPVPGQLTRWLNNRAVSEIHGPRLGLFGGGSRGSKGGGGGGSARSSDAPTGQSLAAIRAYDRDHSRPGGPSAGHDRAEAVHDWGPPVPTAHGRESKMFTVTLNRRPADVPGGSVLASSGALHQWITTSDGISIGMGTAAGVPQSDMPGVRTQVVDHAGQVPTSTTTYANVDRKALNTYLATGTPTGRWMPGVNDCNTWAESTIMKSTPHDIVTMTPVGDTRSEVVNDPIKQERQKIRYRDSHHG